MSVPYTPDPIVEETTKEAAYVDEKHASSLEEGSLEDKVETFDDHDV